MTRTMPTMRRVILESPYAGDVELNVKYACEAMNDSLARGESPLASHLLYTQMLDDTIPAERQLGIDAGHAWMEAAEAIVFYVDLGMSKGMKAAKERADEMNMLCEERYIWHVESQEQRVAYRGASEYSHK